MCFQSEESKIPITKEFLENVLKRRISHFEISQGTKPGDNFAALLLSVVVHFEDTKDAEPLHLLLKTFPAHPIRQRMLEKTNVLLKEKLFYDVWAKELVNFQKEAGGEQLLEPPVPPFIAGAAVDYANEEVTPKVDPALSNFILMVDVRKSMGFKMASKLQGLGYLHVKAVMTQLAKLHALSYAYKKAKGVSKQHHPFLLEEPFFTNPHQRITIQGTTSGNLPMLTHLLQDFFEERPEIAKSFKKLTDRRENITDCFQLYLHPDGMDEEVVEGMLRTTSEEYSGPPLREQWVAGSHGDCWTNNILFKYDPTGKPTDAMLVDLQFFRESCIMGDLAFFLYTSTDFAFRTQYLEEMLELYYNKFVEFCKVLNVEPWEGFTLANFKRKFRRSKLLGFYFAFITLPIVLSKPESMLDMDSLDVGGGDGEQGADEMANIFTKMAARDEEDENLLRSRFVGILTELYDEGVL